jgi:hypothetical protein
MDCCRRRTVLGTLGIALTGFLPVVAQEPALADTLKFGLRARRPIEMQFTAEIAQLVEDGKLPKDFVLAIFDYSRKRRPKFPLPYFEFVVRKKAEELSVPIVTPPLLIN